LKNTKASPLPELTALTSTRQPSQMEFSASEVKTKLKRNIEPLDLERTTVDTIRPRKLHQAGVFRQALRESPSQNRQLQALVITMSLVRSETCPVTPRRDPKNSVTSDETIVLIQIKS